MDPPRGTRSCEHRLTDFEERLPKTARNDLARRPQRFVGRESTAVFKRRLHRHRCFVEPAVPGKIPLNIVYLNTIQDENQKQYFVQELSRELYDWMLPPTTGGRRTQTAVLHGRSGALPHLTLAIHRQGPHQTDLQTGQKVRWPVLAAQNVSDVDYKILAQANTTFIGRFTQPQDVEKSDPSRRAGTRAGGSVANLGPRPVPNGCTRR